jgi:YVTN family beta-propeller protein
MGAITIVLCSVTSLLTQSASSSFLNFESGPVRPLALSPSKGLLFAANTPDNRLEVFRVTADGLERAGETVTGLEPIAIAARTEAEVYVVNHLSDSVSVVDASDPSKPYVKATLLVGDEPRDVVIGGPSHDKVFITTAHRGQNNPRDPQLSTPGVGRADVWVFNANSLSAAPSIITLFCDTPRSLAVSGDGTKVYAAAFHSGSQTTCLHARAVTDAPADNARINDGFRGLRAPPPSADADGVPAPEMGLILKFDGSRWVDELGRDWTARTRFNLPDKDVFVIDAAQEPPVETASVAHVGTILFNLAVSPATGKVYVSNLESLNHVRFEPVVNGHFAENRISIIDGTSSTSVHLNSHIDYNSLPGAPEEAALSLALPLGMEFTQDGQTLYVAAFGSRKVGVLDADARVIARIDVGGGPCGLALDEQRSRLYVLNRFDESISIVDTQAKSQIGVVPLRFNPEPEAVRLGRPVLYNALRSGHGDLACASCHIFADMDDLAWDLGDPNGSVEPNPLQNQDPTKSLQPFHPMKGPMTTQSLRGLLGAGAMHWRGDRNAVSSGQGDAAQVNDAGMAFLAFRPAFQGLMGMGEELPLDEMQRFRDFILTVRYPPNPMASIDGVETADEAEGRKLFDGTTGTDNCSGSDCHTLPLGTSGKARFEQEGQTFKVPHTRNLYQKVGMFGFAIPGFSQSTTRDPAPTPHMGDQIRGFGYLHDGSIPSFSSFLTLGDLLTPRFELTLDRATTTRQITAFAMSFNTGLHPVVGHQVTLTASDLAAEQRFQILKGRADAKHCDLVLHGILGGSVRGLRYLPETGRYQTARFAESLTESDMQSAVAGGAVLTATAVYPGGGTRIGIDRDNDGCFDLDELDLGFDPLDSASAPPFDAPAGLAGREVPSGVSLSWSPVTSAFFSIDGYNVYRSRFSDGRARTKLNTLPVTNTAYLDQTVTPRTYYYVVTALGKGRETAPSSQVAVAVGSATFFLRANCNGDDKVDISDAIYSLGFLFGGGSAPPCADACNSNGDLAHDISDAVYTLGFLFSGGPPPGTFPECEGSTPPDGDCAAGACP